MFHNDFDFDKTDYFYKCNTCGKLFISENNGIFARLLKKIKCPHCGSRDIKLSAINKMINKNNL